MYWATFHHRHPSVRLSVCPSVWLWLTWFGLGMSGQLSQASPTPSPSRSSWSLFWTRWQLSKKFFRPAVTTEEDGDAFWTLGIIDNYLHVWYIHRWQENGHSGRTQNGLVVIYFGFWLSKQIKENLYGCQILNFVKCCCVLTLRATVVLGYWSDKAFWRCHSWL